MSLIEFQDYPSTETPLNAENLNHNFNELNQGNTYSTKETFTGKYWIDGKPIYRKVINLGNLPNATVQRYSIGLTLTQINIINTYGMSKNSDGSAFSPIPNTRQDLAYSVGIFFDSIDKVGVDTKVDRSSWTGYLILEYTKTTD